MGRSNLESLWLMILADFDKGSGVRQDVWKRWKDEGASWERWFHYWQACEARVERWWWGRDVAHVNLALHVRSTIATNLVSQQKYISSFSLGNRQARGPRSDLMLRNVFKAGFCPQSRSPGWAVSPPLPTEDIQNRCMLRGKPLSNQATGSLPACNHQQCNTRIVGWFR